MAALLVLLAVESGELVADTLAEVGKRPDELGQLGRVFQRMAQEVAARKQRFKQQVETLRIEIDETMKARQVVERTETDFFLQLQAQARNRPRSKLVQSRDFAHLAGAQAANRGPQERNARQVA